MAAPEPGGAPRPVPSWDRFVTVLLLVLGVWNVTTTVAQARDLPVFLDTMFREYGIRSGFTATGVASAAGWFVIAANVLCLVLAIGFAVPRLQRRRWAFWIPLACAGISLIVTSGLIAGTMAADPAFIAYLQQPPG